jgi:hypothetical protein
MTEGFLSTLVKNIRSHTRLRSALASPGLSGFLTGTTPTVVPVRMARLMEARATKIFLSAFDLPKLGFVSFGYELKKLADCCGEGERYPDSSAGVLVTTY